MSSAGRARGRARGSAPPQAGALLDDVRRPGAAGNVEGAAQAAPAQGPPAAPRQQSAAPQVGAVQSAPLAGPAPAASRDDQLGQELQRMHLGSGDRRGDAPSKYREIHTKPASCDDKKGTSGTPVPVLANYFRLIMSPKWHMYHYHVDYTPPVDSKRARIAMLHDHDKEIGPVYAFDGMQLYSSLKLTKEVTEFWSNRKSDNEKVKITVKRVSELAPGDPTILMVYNVVFKKILVKIGMKQVNRNYFNPDKSIPIPQHKLEVWPGFISSILQYDGGMLLNVDIAHKILRTDTVLDKMYELFRTSRNTFQDDCCKALIGEIVLTRYNNKTYRVDDIDFSLNPTKKFKLSNGEDISYEQYYKKNYNIAIKDAGQPLLITRPKKKDTSRKGPEVLHLIPELCTMTGLSPDARADFRIMQDIAAHTRIAPSLRCKALLDFIGTLNSNKSVADELKGWELQFDKQLLEIPARCLAPEKILLKDQTMMSDAQTADWSRAVRGNLISTVNLQNWILCYPQFEQQAARDFVMTLQKVAPPMGIEVHLPINCEINNDRTDTYLATLKKSLTRSVQLVVCLLPSNRKDRYDAIKKACCIDFPVPSQIVTTRILKKPQMIMSVCTKVAIQLNCKLGGEVWALEIPLKKLMVMGFDTYHDSAKKGSSVGALVCSLNNTLTRYYSRVSIQGRHEELASNLHMHVVAALKKYHEVNRELPDRVVIYRDGVGDGQLPAVVFHEIPQITTAFAQLGEQNNIKCSVVVVKKRINSRFMAKVQLRNPLPGTIIDNMVTRPEMYDFFLISQSVRQGTVSPTHYNIVHDTMQLKPEYMQRLTYKLTHLYYNWPGTIRVPAPCQYAHKLAFLVGQSIHREPDICLADKLYYL